MTPRLLFAHGWALDRDLWTGVIAALGADAADAVVFDAGYYGRHQPWPAFEPGRPLLGVGQSLGALDLLARPPAPLMAVVAIDGMARFGQAPDFPLGAPSRFLQRMADWLRRDTEVLLDFITRAGGQLPPGQPDTERLIDGLERLRTLDGRDCALPVWRLHAEGDPVASLAMADASFAGAVVIERRLRPAADHLSPLHDPEGCADLIRAALKAVS